MRRRWILGLIVMGACETKSASDKPEKPEKPWQEAVDVFEDALLGGDASTIRGAMGSEAVLAQHYDCARDMSARLDALSRTLAGDADVQAIKGRRTNARSLVTHPREAIPVGPQGGCNVIKELERMRADAQLIFDKDGRDVYRTRLVLAELGGRWYVVGVPEVDRGLKK